MALDQHRSLPMILSMEITEYQPEIRSTVLASWFGASPTALNPADNVVRQAFETAKALIVNELPEKEREVIFGSQATSMQDFVSTLSNACSTYESRKSSKAYVWLEKLSSRVVYYGNVLDVFVQHNPEYVSLAWGTFKFLFISVQHHEEMVKNLAKSCANIAETLPRADLSLILYPTPAMREAVARLYAVILRFIAHSVRWYRQSRIKHMLTSITNPWSLDYDPELREVEQHARTVDKLAQSGAQAELREAHIQIHQIRSDLQAARGEIKLLANLVEDKFEKLIEFALTSNSLQLRISQDVTSSKHIISHVQLGQLLSLPFMNSLPTSGQCLAHCRSLRIRRRGVPKLDDTGPGSAALRKFAAAAQPTSSFLVIENGSATYIKDILFDMIGLLRHRHSLPVLWVLRPPGLQTSHLTTLDVIRMLVHQALELNSAAAVGPTTPFPITVANLREASSHEDWLTLLKRALDGLPSTVYIVIDSDVMEHVTDGDRAKTTYFLMKFTQFLGPETARFIVSSYAFEADLAKAEIGRQAVAAVTANEPETNFHMAKKRRIRSQPYPPSLKPPSPSHRSRQENMARLRAAKARREEISG